MTTKSEQAWLDAICRIGCCVCIRRNLGHTPGEPHHMLDGNLRLGHLFTVYLCPTHHRSGLNNRMAVSRHPWRTEFERRYGTEVELHTWTKKQVLEAQRVAA